MMDAGVGPRQGPPRRLAWLIVIASVLLTWLPLWYSGEREQGGFPLALATVVLVWGGFGAHTLLVVVAATFLAWRTGRWGRSLGVAVLAIALCAGCMTLVGDADDQSLAMMFIGAWAAACAGGGLWAALRTSPLSR